MEPTYNYIPLLTPDSLRLFTLRPGIGDATIEGSLTTTSLSDSVGTTPEFKALSYTWSNPIDKGNLFYNPYDVVDYHISCDGRRMKVTQNLHDALWQLRGLKESSPLWIDAICINQYNIHEKSHQLKLMSRIYADASWVIIWLGKEDPTTHGAIQSIKKKEDSLITTTMFSSSNPTKCIQFNMTNQESDAVANLLQRTWFSRLWTLQEVLLPERTLTLCGSRVVDIGLLALFAEAIVQNNQEIRTICENTRPSGAELASRRFGAAASIAAWLGCTWHGGSFGSRAFLRYHKVDYEMAVSRTFKWVVALEILVHETRQRECSEASDRIMAPLAFAMHKSSIPDTDFSHLEMDIQTILGCSQPTPELYCRFTHFMINAMGNLDILSRAHRNEDRQESDLDLGLPTWVPPFHTPGSTSLIDELLFTQYDAAKHLGPQWKGMIIDHCPNQAI
jgi:hypothetical protein